MFWVVTEVCSEHNPVRRMKIIKQFIKVAREWIGGGRGR
jgi:Rap guanine nucleotide exchange factor 2